VNRELAQKLLELEKTGQKKKKVTAWFMFYTFSTVDELTLYLTLLSVSVACKKYQLTPVSFLFGRLTQPAVAQEKNILGKTAECSSCIVSRANRD